MEGKPIKSEDREEERNGTAIPNSDGRGYARPRNRCSSSSSNEDELTGGQEGGAKAKQKRARSDDPMNSPVAGFMFPGYSVSPPNFVSLEEIMKAANGVSNMALAHEIAVDKNFEIEKPEPKENTLMKQVKQIVHKAFWDVLREQLDSDPPLFTQALSLMTEIKQDLLSLLLPQHTSLRSQIEAILDVDLIKQKAENGAMDFDYYAEYVLSIMAKLCAPVRDEKIRQVMVVRGVIPLFQEIMELLGIMKVDFANYMIRTIRPYIQQHSVEYERQKFKEFLNTQNDGLEQTKIWLKSVIEKMKESGESNVDAFNVLPEAYMKLLKWDCDDSYPETVIMDECRFNDCSLKLARMNLTASILLITLSTVGLALQGLASFKLSLKQNVMTIIEDVNFSNQQKLDDVLKSVAIQVIIEVNKALEEHDFPKLKEKDEKILKNQIENVSSSENEIKKIVESRSSEFIQQVIRSVTASPTKIPPGLSSFQSELANVTGQFLRLVSHNRAVFGEYYADIISKCN